MAKISNSIIKKQKSFWNNCVFHPTDAVEDPWGRRILDKMSEDKAIDTVRIYTMFEDIIYIGENGDICYDYRVSDLRLDYLLEKGYNLTLAYAGIPDCIASSNQYRSSVSKNKTRYKGKMWNTSPPADYAVWEEICYEYTKHLVERYGLEQVKKWDLHCFNEPDIPQFFLGQLDRSPESTSMRCKEYCKLFEAFVKGVSRVSTELRTGGPALAHVIQFFEEWLDFVKEKKMKLDFITAHYYGTDLHKINGEGDKFCVESLVAREKKYERVIADHGFAHVPLIIDEWGMAANGFLNIEECPPFIARENEIFSAYFAKLIARYIEEGFNIEKLMICLSGQHEMVEDFTGFRNFFTLNFIKKPIYNAFILSSRLHENLLKSATETKDLYVVATKSNEGAYSVLASYSSLYFEEDIPEKDETFEFEESIIGKKITVWCIDKNHTNPFRMWERMGKPEMTKENLAVIKNEGILKPFITSVAESNSITLPFLPNSTYLITVE